MNQSAEAVRKADVLVEVDGADIGAGVDAEIEGSSLRASSAADIRFGHSEGRGCSHPFAVHIEDAAGHDRQDPAGHIVAEGDGGRNH